MKIFNEGSMKPWNTVYNGFKIKLNTFSECYDIYDKYDELEDAGFRSIEDAKKGIDNILALEAGN